MYKVQGVCGSYDITKMIDGNDIYNSQYLYLLDDLPVIGSYSTPYYKGRLDIVISCIYDLAPATYYSTISVYNRLYLDNCTCMVDIKYPSDKCIFNLVLS